MAKQSSTSEPKAPLIVALAFFVLASLVLGVLFYLETDKKTSAVAEAKKAGEEKSNADKLRTEEQNKVRMYKVALGVADAEDFTALSQSSDPKVAEEFNKLNAALPAKLKGLTDKVASTLVGQNKSVQLKPTDLLSWPSLAAGKADKEPEVSMADALVRAVAARLLAEGKQATAEKSLEAATKSFQEQAAAAEAAKKALDAQIELVKKEAKDALDKQAAELTATRKQFGDKTNDYTAAEKKAQEDSTKLNIELEESRKAGKALQDRVEVYDDKTAAAEDPFRTQKPLGRVTSREPGGNTVYIDLGSADSVPVGLRLTVQPANTPQVGIAGRLRPRVGPTGRPVLDNGQPQYDMVPKGKLEVIAVEGEKLARCRITSESDPYRDRIEVGDLLYNTSWRRGQTDTVVLYGVFDADGDGTDDVKRVIGDLRRMNIQVAAYFDLEQRKWLDPTTGRPTTVTEQAAYAIEGAYPAPQAGDALTAVRSEIETALNVAKKQAKDRGIKLVRARTYFPQIGYEYRGGDVPADRVNQAYNRYLRAAPAGDAPSPAEGK